jgi:hypothetical protein
MKYKWRVGSVPTGRYRSFEMRPWPGLYGNEQILASISCDEEYVPDHARTGQHTPLTLFVYNYSQGTQQRKIYRLKKQFATLPEAKAAAEAYFKNHPEALPNE